MVKETNPAGAKLCFNFVQATTAVEKTKYWSFGIGKNGIKLNAKLKDGVKKKRFSCIRQITDVVWPICIANNQFYQDDATKIKESTEPSSNCLKSFSFAWITNFAVFLWILIKPINIFFLDADKNYSVYVCQLYIIQTLVLEVISIGKELFLFCFWWYLAIATAKTAKAHYTRYTKTSTVV